ncbi:phospholipase effector Tle1 domain-containing protein [Sulfurimonas sp.]|uniref:phospholipase effector Tle1 domain-containing protein n=1 Tax=Sulfurimonas sp. TaxID=2022749 RepID=UPI003D1098F1
MSKMFDGDVHYNNDEMIHCQSFENVDGTICQQDGRTRFAYMVVSEAEALEAAGTLDDDKAVLDAVKSEYGALLSQAIEKEKVQVSQTLDLAPNEIVIENKLIHLISISASNVTCKDDLLYALKYNNARKNLSDADKKMGEHYNLSYLRKNYQECETMVAQELKQVKKENPTKKEQTPYVLLSTPYVYNSVLDENYSKVDYVCTDYQDLLTLSLMPKTKIEYGVFFDGTNNNMYNIDFYQDHKTYLNKTAAYVKEHFLPYGDESRSTNELSYTTFAQYIATHPDPQKTKYVMNMLRDEVVNHVRYFEPSSQMAKNYGDDTASKHSDEIFAFFYELRDTLTKKDEGWGERLSDWWNDHSEVKGTSSEIKSFIIDKLLPKGILSDSYVNGYTNVKRLYEHYRGDDRLILKKDKKAYEHGFKRFKLYASGSGTIDPVDRQKLDSDNFVGLGLGGGMTGVKAHIVYTCDKIASQLRESNVSKIDELILDVFGFSRGATEARHFSCTIMNSLELLNKDGYEKYALNGDVEGKNIFSALFPGDGGVYTVIANRHYFNPLCTDVKGITKTIHSGGRSAEIFLKNPYYGQQELTIKSVAFRHVNIGDTVTHYGLMQSNDSKDLNIHFDKEKIGSVFHLMAMDEFRNNFRAHSIFEQSYEGIVHTEGEFKELFIPGAHADVGGGYENSPAQETIEFPQEIRGSEKFPTFRNAREDDYIKWNKRYGWIDSALADQESDFTEAKILSLIKNTGFYYQKDYFPSNSLELTTGRRAKTFYMHRTGLSWEYELVALKLFYDAATADGVELPLVDLIDEYKLSKKSDGDYLKQIYTTLKANRALPKEEHMQLRKKYVHHSSSSDSVANPPSEEGYNIVYGQRVIYGSKGEKFPFKSF